MINLIPNEEKKRMANSFYYRLVILVFLMLGISTCFAILVILPSLFLSNTRDKFADGKLSMQKAEPVPVIDQKTLTAIQELDNKLSIIENAERDTFIVTEKVINEIIESRVADIKITRISYENYPINGKKIGISGTATSREQLLLFRRALESNPVFKNVNLPISNFVKGSDIQFFLSVIPS